MCNNKEAGNTEVLLNSRYNDYGGEAFWENIWAMEKDFSIKKWINKPIQPQLLSKHEKWTAELAYFSDIFNDYDTPFKEKMWLVSMR